MIKPQVMHNRMEELKEMQKSKGDFDGFKILHVEDNTFDSKWFSAAISKHNYLGFFEVEHTKTLERALHLLDRRNFDLVVTDLRLPDSVNGESVRKITKEHPWLPVLVLTSSDEPAVAIDCIKNGARDYFVKNRTRGEELARSMRFAMLKNLNS